MFAYAACAHSALSAFSYGVLIAVTDPVGEGSPTKELIQLSNSRKTLVTVTTVIALAAGLVAGVAVAASGKPHHGKASKKATATSTSTTATTTTPSGSNEDATHESGETAAREAAEASGQARGNDGAFKPNEDPAHEANESATREAQEDAGQKPTGP